MQDYQKYPKPHAAKERAIRCCIDFLFDFSYTIRKMLVTVECHKWNKVSRNRTFTDKTLKAGNISLETRLFC